MPTAHIGCGIPEPLVGSLKEGTEVSLTIWSQVQAGIQIPSLSSQAGDARGHWGCTGCCFTLMFPSLFSPFELRSLHATVAEGALSPG